MIDVKSAQIFILLLGVVFHFPTWPFPKQEKEGRKYDFYVQILTFQMTNYRRLYVRNSSVLFCRSVQEFCFYCGYFLIANFQKNDNKTIMFISFTN